MYFVKFESCLDSVFKTLILWHEVIIMLFESMHVIITCFLKCIAYCCFEREQSWPNTANSVACVTQCSLYSRLFGLSLD